MLSGGSALRRPFLRPAAGRPALRFPAARGGAVLHCVFLRPAAGQTCIAFSCDPRRGSPALRFPAAHIDLPTGRRPVLCTAEEQALPAALDCVRLNRSSILYCSSIMRWRSGFVNPFLLCAAALRFRRELRISPARQSRYRAACPERSAAVRCLKGVRHASLLWTRRVR